MVIASRLIGVTRLAVSRSGVPLAQRYDTDRARPVRRRTAVARVPAVLNQRPDVPGHVRQAPCIRHALPDRVRSTERVPRVPCDAIEVPNPVGAFLGTLRQEVGELGAADTFALLEEEPPDLGGSKGFAPWTRSHTSEGNPRQTLPVFSSLWGTPIWITIGSWRNWRRSEGHAAASAS